MVVPFDAYQQLVAESLASQAALALHNRALRQNEASLLRYKRELQIGRDIQAGFFPAELLQPRGWEIAARFLPAQEVAGDFYDVFALHQGRLGLVVADVCDKGLSAALFMALLRSLVRAFIQQQSIVLAGLDEPGPADASARILLETIRLTNNYLAINHRATHIFATLFVAILDPHNGELVYLNCGHVPPFVLKANVPVQRLAPGGPAVGLLLEAVYTVHKTLLEPGDMLVAFTDGVVEVRDSDGQFFGESRLLALLTGQEVETGRSPALDSAISPETPGFRGNEDLSLHELLGEVEAQVRAFALSPEPSDDLALLAVRRNS
jgi:serine phosphatase RsbU (regulator of sigma subunit)